MAANITLEKLPKPSALAMGKSEFDSGLCRWFNETVSGIDRPWLIRDSHLNSVDEKKHEILVNTQLDEKEARTELIKSMAQAKWQSSGLPLNSDDILTGALYRHWQQSWFSNHFGQTNVDANSVFPLTEEQQQTLKMSANQPYLQAADQQIRAWKAGEVQWRPTFWHQISDLPNHLADDFIKEASAIGGDKAPEHDKPEVDEKQAPALDQRKNHESQPVDKTLTVYDKAPEKYMVETYEEQAKTLKQLTNNDNQKKRHVEERIVFHKENPSSRMDRWGAWDVYVSAQGDVKWINISDQHMQGVEVLIPDRLPQHDQEVTLASNQTLATIKMTSNNGQYPLPSLVPDDCILALRTEPHASFTLFRDCYTGLHTVFIPNSGANQSIEFTYVVEPRETGKKIPAEDVRPAQSTRFDVRCSETMKTVLKGVLDNIEQQPTEVQVPLQRIKNAKSTMQRIEAIENYCWWFSCDALPEHNKNFFHFLVTQRQGGCIHRASVFAAFCRYFGIPCRLISSRVHAFAEYSLDRGQTWESAELDGADVEVTEIMPQFQPVSRVRCSGNESRQARGLLKNVMKDADSAQQQILAEASGMSLEELNKVLETGSALSEKIPGTFEIVKHLWEAKDLTRFSIGASMLQSLETEAFGEDEKALVGKVFEYGSQYKPMAEALKIILSSSDEDQVSEQLKSLHSKMIDQVGTPPEQWLCSIVDVLANSDLTRPVIIHFAREALESGWLDPVLSYKTELIQASVHHELLVRLESVDELNIKAAHCLKKWYGVLMSREKNNQQWQQDYESFQKSIENTLFITHHHDGHSPFLKNKIASPSIEIAWTNKPEGVPNIERILLQQPAFMQSNSGKGNHRPVIILGEISPRNKAINEKAEALFQRKLENSPDFKQMFEKINQCKAMEKRQRDALMATDSRKEKLDINSKYQSFLKSNEVTSREKLLVSRYKKECKKAIQQAFIHYLYGMTHSNVGSLTYCWAYPSDWRENDRSFGAHDPSSPGELYAMMSLIGSSDWSQEAIKDDYLRHAHNASDALILKNNELTKIAEEFVNSMNLNSLYDSLDTALESDYDGFFRLW